MADTKDVVAGDPATASDPDKTAWLARIEEVGEDAGYFQTIGNRHWAFFSDEDPILIVTFETMQSIRAREDGLPMGHAIARERGWSSLCLISDGETWYRDAAVYRYFDRLVDDAFFEDFDRVVFYGAGMGAYAACAFSVTAPGATVLAVQPVATLDPAIAGWDRRHLRQRRLSFSDRYGFAPDMTEGAGEVFTFFDPSEPLDAMHAALFTAPYVTALRCPLLGARIEAALEQMKLLPELIVAAGEGALNASHFHRAFRARRRYGPYLRELMSRLDAASRPRLAGLLARNVNTRMQAPRFRQRLAELTAQGVQLPPQGKVNPS